MKIPTVVVPVNILLDLIRAYKEQPQEILHPHTYLHVTTLEQRSYRKFLAWKKIARKQQSNPDQFPGSAI